MYALLIKDPEPSKSKGPRHKILVYEDEEAACRKYDEVARIDKPKHMPGDVSYVVEFLEISQIVLGSGITIGEE